MAEAASARDAIRRFKEQRPDLVILDLNLPGAGGLEAVRRFQAEDPAVPILVFSMHADALFARLAPAAFLLRPIAERHRLVFYLGHVEAFERTCQADLSYNIEGVGQFRCNVYTQRGTTGLVFRKINAVVAGVQLSS